jgi:hypothetical protein
MFSKEIYLMIFLRIAARSPFVLPQNVVNCTIFEGVHKIFTFYIPVKWRDWNLKVQLRGQRVKPQLVSV